MSVYRIKKDDLSLFLEKLREYFAVYAPVESDGITSFAELEPGQEPAFGILKTQKPPKEVFYPQNEIMFRFNEEGMTPELYDGKPIALFGVRPCDAKGFNIIERVFVDPKYEDPYWSARRKGSLVFALACNEPLLSCFCNWFGGGPFDKTGSDVLVIDTGEDYLFEPTNEGAEKLLSNIGGFEKAEKADIEKAGKLRKKAESSMGEPPKLDSVKETLDNSWNSPLWDRISAKCLGCAVCTFSCPTCYCFDIQDETRRDKGTRVRLWDTCQFPLFTKEGSGHNPRKSQTSRLRQRFMHKFSYMVETLNEFGCVGCGRCVTLCPVNLDVRDFLEKIAAEKDK